MDNRILGEMNDPLFLVTFHPTSVWLKNDPDAQTDADEGIPEGSYEGPIYPEDGELANETGEEEPKNTDLEVPDEENEEDIDESF